MTEAKKSAGQRRWSAAYQKGFEDGQQAARESSRMLSLASAQNGIIEVLQAEIELLRQESACNQIVINGYRARLGEKNGGANAKG